MSNFNLKTIWFDFWGKADDVKSNVLNSIFARVDAFLYKTIERTASSEPTDPVDREIIRIVSPATGRFVQKENWLAYYYNGSYRLVEPKKGFYYYDKSVGGFIYYDGTQWTKNTPTGQCFADHNSLHNYDEHEHEDWGEPGAYKIDIERLPESVQDLIDSSSCINPQVSHYDLLEVARDDDEHIDWTEPGNEKIDVERLGEITQLSNGVIRLKNGKLFADIESHIENADGTLADITAKFNTLLSYLENLKILEES